MAVPRPRQSFLGNGACFRDRREAGVRLAERLRRYRHKPGAVVLGLPRGGVVPAAEIARTLELPLDVVISRKLGAPWNPELAMGAIAEGGEAYVNSEVAELGNVSTEAIAAAIAAQKEEIARRQRLFRAGRPLILPGDCTAILVDDGIATGATAIAAVRALRKMGVARIVLTAGVAPPDTAATLRAIVDELVVVETPIDFGAVGFFFEEFGQVSDEEVSRLLDEAAAAGRRLPTDASPAEKQ